MTASPDTNVPSPPGAGSPEVGRHRSPLGSWTLARWTPPDLAGLVEGVWCFEGTLELLRERHFPLGTLELIVHLGPVYGHVEGTRVQPFPRSCFSGLLLGPDVIEAPPGSSSVLGIRLRPAGAYRLLQRPRRALGMVRSGGAPLVDVALACGYSDQPHFNREFRELSGFAPGEYEARQKFPESASVAEATG